MNYADAMQAQEDMELGICRMYARNIRAVVKAESPEIANDPARTMAIEKLLRVSHVDDQDVWLASLADDSGHAIENIMTELAVLSENEQRLATGKTRKEWLALLAT